MALSTAQVNARLAQFALTVAKVDNSYFNLLDVNNDVVASVYVSSLSHLTLDQWEDEGRAAELVTTEPTTVTAESVSAMLRAAAASFAKESYKEFLAEAEASGVRRSLARRQFRKVHGSSRA